MTFLHQIVSQAHQLPLTHVVVYGFGIAFLGFVGYILLYAPIDIARQKRLGR